ncbi:hypothetical protein JCM10296v2_005926 [Rhodotorula toruloides]
MGLITHIVAFKYKDGTTDAEKHLVASSFLALQDQCKLQGTEENYLSVTGGSNNSPEGFNKGCEHAWVVTFRNTQERDYYLDKDPAHQAFKDKALPFITDAFVFDFEQGTFASSSP